MKRCSRMIHLVSDCCELYTKAGGSWVAILLWQMLTASARISDLSFMSSPLFPPQAIETWGSIPLQSLRARAHRQRPLKILFWTSWRFGHGTIPSLWHCRFASLFGTLISPPMTPIVSFPFLLSAFKSCGCGFSCLRWPVLGCRRLLSACFPSRLI